MTSAAVDFLVEKILHLLADKVELIIRVKDDMEALRKDLCMFKAFLNDCTKSKKKTEALKELIKQIREVTYKAEDAVESYVTEAAIRHESFSKRLLSSIVHLPKLATIAGDIASISEDVKKVYEYKQIAFDSLTLEIESSQRKPKEKKAPDVEKDDVVGFDEEARKVMAKLKGGSHDQLEVVSIVGMAGLGKTTLANKVYTDGDIEFEFMVRSWVYVSKTYTEKEVFLKILRDISGGVLAEEMHKMHADDLAAQLRSKLQRHKKFLIVVDDVWSKKAWDDLKIAFPKNTGGRIVLTSRNRDVAVHVQESGVHDLRFLTKEECWELLQKKVFRKEPCPHELKQVGEEIAEKCHGLPLAVVIVAGILLKKVSEVDWWSKISTKVSEYVIKDEDCSEVVKLSYDNLSDQLKLCFVYFGVFPEDFEIPASKIILLWIAEGFIERKSGESLEETAEEYLEELVDKNLVLVQKRGLDGRIKICRVHDIMHDLCKKEAEEQNLFKVLKDPNDFLSSEKGVASMHRRLCIHSRVLDYIKSEPSAVRTRSFVSMAVEEVKVPLEQISFIPKAFQLIRLLDVTSIIFERFPKELLGLVHLRYMAIAITFHVLPSNLSKLWNMQILMVKVISGNKLDIKANIWEMFQLRHIHTNVSAKFVAPPSKPKKQKQTSPGIRTLTQISADSCTADFLAQTPMLTKLGIRGSLEKLIDVHGGGGRAFAAFANLNYLETLKLYGDASSISSFPKYNRFPPNLRKLTITDTMLSWEHMATLGMLPHLVVLKLKENAFKGKYWKPKSGGFRSLQVLYLGRTDIEKWEVSSDHFPTLKKLFLRFCDRLEGVPLSLANIQSLQTIDVYWTNPSVADSARQIQKEKKSTFKTALQVTIFPPNHDPENI